MRSHFYGPNAEGQQEAKLLVPFIIVAFSWISSLSIRFVFGLDGVGLTLSEGINEIVKVTSATALIWLFLRNIPPFLYKKKIPKKSALVDLSVAGAYLLTEQLVISRIQPPIQVLLVPGMTYAIALLLTVRHYSKEELRLFLNDLGICVPWVRIMACWAVTVTLFLSLISLSAGANFQAFLEDYFHTLQIHRIQENWLYIFWIIFPWLAREELFFRVFIQTRLEKLLPTALAIIIQGLIFSIIHIPSNAIYLGWGWNILPHLANTLLLTNGIIGGYLWHRTKNLPILILYHWTTYPLMPLLFFPSHYLPS